MTWKIEFFDSKVEKSIKAWPVKILAKFTLITELIEDFGPNEIGMPHIRPMGKGLYEIRAKGHEGIGRAFFCLHKGKGVVILHGFIKKTEKAPNKEIEIARKRIIEVKQDD